MEEESVTREHRTRLSFLHVFFSPSRAFAAAAVRRAGFPWLPILLFTLVLGSTSMMIQPIAARDGAELIMRSPGMSKMIDEGQLESIRNPSTVRLVVGSIARPVLSLLGLLAYALLILIAANLAGCELGYGMLFHAVLISAMIDPVLSSIVRTPLILARDTTLGISTGLGLLAPDAPIGSLAAKVLGTFDLFSIWALVALVIGITVLAGIRTKKAAMIVSAAWVLKNGALITFSMLTQGLAGFS